MSLRIAQMGLGPIGRACLTLAASKPWAQIVGAIEIDPASQGRDLGELTGIPSLQGQTVCSSLDELLAHQRPEVVLHTTVSKFKDANDCNPFGIAPQGTIASLRD